MVTNPNTQAQQIQPTNKNSSVNPPAYGSKVITPEEIRKIVEDSANDIAAESNLDAALSNRKITIKSFKVFWVGRENNVEDIAYSMADFGFPAIIVVFTEDQKQSVLSLQRGSSIDFKCEYGGYAAGKVIFGFESFD